MRALAVLTAALAALLMASSASALTFTLMRGAPRNPQLIQRAISYQVNVQVARYYQIDPVRFGPNGIPVYFVNQDILAQAWQDQGGSPDETVLGFHTHLPSIWVIRDGIRDDSTMFLSHEILETETDPTTTNDALEIADPVAAQSYRMWGVMLSDWVLPDGSSFAAWRASHA